jgi:hypothetical protein
VVKVKPVTGKIWIVDVAVMPGFATAVAITLAVVTELTTGAVYTPALEIVPAEAVHVTDLLEAAVTLAVNVSWAPLDKLSVDGVSVSVMFGTKLMTALTVVSGVEAIIASTFTC